MATARHIDVAMRANTADFTQKLGFVERKLHALRGSFSGAMSAAMKFGAVLSAVAAGAFLVWARRNAEVLDRIAKLSDQLGTTTEDLISLQHAASISGVSMESLQRSLQYFNKSLGEARTGIGEAVYGLKELGLSSDDLIGKGTWEQIGIIAERFEKLGTQQQKAFVATKLFGRAGSDLTNLLQQGRRELERYRAEAEAFGALFSREELAQVEAMNDAFARFKLALGALGSRVLVNVSPALRDFFNDLRDWLVRNREKISDFFETALNKLREFGEKLPAILPVIETFARVTGLRMAYVAGKFGLAAAMGGKFVELFGDFGAMLQKWGIGSSDEQYKNLGLPTPEQMSDWGAEVKDLGEKLASGAWDAALFATGMKEIGERVAAMQAAFGGAGDGAKDATNKAADAVNKMSTAAQTAADSVFTLLDGIIVKGQNAADVLRSVLQSIASMALRQGVNAAFGQIGVATPK